MDSRTVERLRSVFFQTQADIEANMYVDACNQVTFSQSPEMHQSAIVATPAEIARTADGQVPDSNSTVTGETAVVVKNVDSLEGAELAKSITDRYTKEHRPPLVLNFANPYEPGGGKMHGSIVQEEDLCRRTTVYASLTSDEAQAFYRTNKESGTYLFSHAMMISPYVEVFRNSDYEYLGTPREIAVLTCAAPFVPELDSITETELFATIKARIAGMLLFATSNGYRALVLGAWGCGAFGNSPHLVARAFREALMEVQNTSSAPLIAVFAVLDRTHDKHTFRTFEDTLGKCNTRS
ncbi:MAG: TIGR02452 family protein [Coriobacteriales bacterium]|nr:TIGR02452 family protein [Coriobacteriales bacterium]